MTEEQEIPAGFKILGDSYENTGRKDKNGQAIMRAITCPKCGEQCKDISDFEHNDQIYGFSSVCLKVTPEGHFWESRITQGY